MTTASAGPAMDPDEEAVHRRDVARTLADEADVAIRNVRRSIKDLQASLKVREAEAKRLRAEAREKP